MLVVSTTVVLVCVWVHKVHRLHRVEMELSSILGQRLAI